MCSPLSSLPINVSLEEYGTCLFISKISYLTILVYAFYLTIKLQEISETEERRQCQGEIQRVCLEDCVKNEDVLFLTDTLTEQMFRDTYLGGRGVMIPKPLCSFLTN